VSFRRTALVALVLVAPLACGRTGSLDSPSVDPGDGSIDTSIDVPVSETGVDFGVDISPPPDDILPPPDDFFPPPDDTIIPPDDIDPPPPFDTGVEDIAPPPDDTIVPPDDTSPPPPIDSGIDIGPPDTGSDIGPPDTGFDTGSDTGIDGGITCGTSVCDPKTQDCCASFTGFSCITKGGACGGPTLTCSSAASCSKGQVCCISPGGGGPPSAKCAFICLGVQLCATDTECGFGRKCLPVFGGISTCR